jgi:hypothetical protein
MKKNLTWFAHKGADERETSILSAAYQRSIVVLWLGLIVLWCVAKFDLSASWLGNIGFESIFALLMFLSIMSGWHTLRHEELEYAPATIKKSPSIITLGAIVALLFGIAATVIFVAPLYTWVAIVGFIFAELVVGAICAWKWTKPYTTHSRVLASLIFPFQVLGFLAPHKAKTSKRIWCAILASLYFIGTPFTAAIALFDNAHLVDVTTWNGVLVPGIVDYTDQNHVAPRTHNIILNYRDTDVTVGDVILYNKLAKTIKMEEYEPGSFRPAGDFDTNGDFVPVYDDAHPYQTIQKYGTVLSVDGNTLTVDVSDGTATATRSETPNETTFSEESHQETVQASDVVATVLVNAPLAGVAEKLLW